MKTNFHAIVDSQKPSLWDDIAKNYTDTPDEGEIEIAIDIEGVLHKNGIFANSSLLEAGCGSGHISAFLANKGYETTLLDFSEIALNKAKQVYEKNKLVGRFIKSDLFDISPESVGYHDVVWNSGVLEHFDGWQIIQSMQKMANVAKKFVIILVPNPKSSSYMGFRKKTLENGDWKWGLEILRDNLKDLATVSGLEIVEEHYLGTSHIKYFEKFLTENAKDDKELANIPANQRYLKLIIARPVSQKLDLEKKLHLLLNILKVDSSALRQTYYSDVSILMEKLSFLKNDLTLEKQTVSTLKNDLDFEKQASFQLRNELLFERNRIKQIHESKIWKLTLIFEKKFRGKLSGRIIEKIVDLLIKKKDNQNQVENKSTRPIEKKKESLQVNDPVQTILKNNKNVKGIIIYPPTVDWNIPLFQRPQHMALHLAQNNWLYFYCTTNTYDKVDGFEMLSQHLYLTNKYDELIAKLDSFLIFIHSAHPTFTLSDIKKLENKGTIIYDYLDEIHPSISGFRVTDVIDRHKYLMKNSKLVLATAKKLFSDVKQHRETGICLLPNAVDYDHFHKKSDPKNIPKEIKSIKETKGPIIGYFGALATWFDYELIKNMATIHPDWNIVLIGWDYDQSLDKSGIKELKNVHYLGIKDYSILPEYAIWFDVCILPFLLNDVTHSTSPIKLFEYMALGKPIVSTAIQEVSNYKSILIAENPDDFIDKVKHALEIRNDKQYLELVDKEAKQNTWKKRFDNLD
ncbi:MAG: methyltransferase domain-containing protein, partial [Nitrosopumilus sp.]|nr:methyltransferase domain-containing protein [Nitrosopumilus sp.]